MALHIIIYNCGYICAAYRAPSCDSTIFDQLDKDISYVTGLKSSPLLVIVGDLNSHNHDWLGSKSGSGTGITNEAGTATENLCITHGLTQTVDFPTHDTLNLEKPLLYSKIDLVLTNKPSHMVSTDSLPPLGLSRHLIIRSQWKEEVPSTSSSQSPCPKLPAC